MGRKAGVTAEQTRAELLSAAAQVFALKGYDGASIADITNEADLSSGAIYAHYGSKAELFIAVVREHGRREFTELVGGEQPDDGVGAGRQVSSVTELLTVVGSSFDRRHGLAAALMIEAIVASKRHPEVAELVESWLVGGETVLAKAVTRAQAGGEMADDIGAAALGRFVTMVALGARLATALGLPVVDHDEWAHLITRLVGSFGVDGEPGDPQPDV